MKPKILSQKLEYECSWMKIEEAKIKLPNGKIKKWQKVTLDDFVEIVPVDKDKNVYFSKEWRVSWGKNVLQFPAGSCAGLKGKEILQQARNELREEIGMDARKWEKLSTCLNNARIKIKCHIFLARDLYPSKKKNDDDEIIEIIKMPFDKAYKLILSGKIPTTSATILGMMLVKERLNL